MYTYRLKLIRIMELTTLTKLIDHDGSFYCTPFLTKGGRLFFLSSGFDTVEEADDEKAEFEGMTGLRSLTDPMLSTDITEWVEKLVRWHIVSSGADSLN